MGLNWKGALAGVGKGLSAAGSTAVQLGARMEDKRLAQAETLRKENLALRLRDEERTYNEGQAGSGSYHPETLKELSNTELKSFEGNVLSREEYLTKVAQISARAKGAGEKEMMGVKLSDEYKNLADALAKDETYRNLSATLAAAKSEEGMQLAQRDIDLYVIKKNIDMQGTGGIKISNEAAIKLTQEVDDELPEPGSDEAKDVVITFNKANGVSYSYSQIREAKIQEATSKYISDVSSVKGGGRAGAVTSPDIRTALGGPKETPETKTESKDKDKDKDKAAVEKITNSVSTLKDKYGYEFETGDPIVDLRTMYAAAKKQGDLDDLLSDLKSIDPLLYKHFTSAISSLEGGSALKKSEVPTISVGREATVRPGFQTNKSFWMK